MSVQGYVYLVHLERPVAHAQHYTGWTRDVEMRMGYHMRGAGGRLLAAAAARGIKAAVVWVWQGDRAFERTLHDNSHNKRRCPVCRGDETIDWSLCPSSTYIITESSRRLMELPRTMPWSKEWRKFNDRT